MKKNIYIVVLALFAATLFNVSAAKAEVWDHDQNYSQGPRDNGGNNSGFNNNNHNNGPSDNGGKTTTGGPSTSSPGTNLPINGGVVFLFVAGMAIGVVTLKKFKSLTPALAV